MGYAQEQDKYILVSQVLKDASALSLSGTELRRHLNEGLDIPEWFSFPEVVHSLRVAYPPRSQQGFTVFFTGLPSSGKSTLANVLLSRLMELGTRPVALLDGDLARKNLSSELGFSKEYRDLNILRILYVASEITKNHGAAICAPIAPYTAIRRHIRETIGAYADSSVPFEGNRILVVHTPWRNRDQCVHNWQFTQCIGRISYVALS